LAGQCAAIAEPNTHSCLRTNEPMPDVQLERLRTAGHTIETVRDLESSLADGDVEDVRKSISLLIDLCGKGNQRDYFDFIDDTARYYDLVGPLLGVKTLEEISSLNISFSARVSVYHSTKFLLQFEPLIAALNHYRMRKHEDMWLTPLEALQPEDFDLPLTLWRRLRDELLDATETMLPVERLLLERIAETWDEILVNEQQNELLQDVVATVERLVTEEAVLPRNNAEAMSRLAEHHRLINVAFANLFMRLVLSTEPTYAAFAELEKDGSIARLRILEQNGGIRIVDSLPDRAPEWLLARIATADPDESINLRPDERGVRWRAIVTKEVGEGLYPRVFIFGFDRYADPGRFMTLRITALLVVHALLFRQVSMQQQAMEGRIFSMVAHNLGSPVYHVRSHARILADGRMDATGRREARFAKYNEILRQGRHMQGVIDAILSFDGRETQLELTEISLATLTYDVVRTMRPEAKGKVEIDFEKPGDADVKRTMFLTDEIRLYDVLLNLVGNAIKYSPFDSSVSIQVSVKENHGAEFRIRDYGPGIPSREKDRIFEPFFRGRHARDAEIPGLGLGLNIAYLYVTALGGRLSFSNEDRGTTFTVYLPPLNTKRGATRDDAHLTDR
ncbi:MAG TPA: HAMP domain-containing sensor histidine kinase, partial [Thermoanaerobaculia bacterium]|nr:HAMP domain-containing sensor histidine kinase [Thermoanaerobaculia bacterium]